MGTLLAPIPSPSAGPTLGAVGVVDEAVVGVPPGGDVVAGVVVPSGTVSLLQDSFSTSTTAS